MAERGLQRFLVFTAPKRGERKAFIASFAVLDAAIAEAEKLKVGATTYWQVVDKISNQVVAEEMSHLG